MNTLPMAARLIIPLCLRFCLPLPLRAQSHPPKVWRGAVVEHPELISGVWETRDGTGFVGLAIELTTYVHGQPKTLAGVDQHFEQAYIEIYRRAGSAQRPSDGGWFSDSSAGVAWSDWNLRIDSHGPPGSREMQATLAFNPNLCIWTGRIRIGTAEHSVVLRRPSPWAHRATSPFEGTWSGGGTRLKCLHFTEDQDGNLVGWSDDLIAPGLLRYANHLQPPSETLERFGVLAKVTSLNESELSIEMHALDAMCCSVPLLVKLLPSGRSMEGSIETEPASWSKQEGDSCIAADTRGVRKRPR